MDQPPHDTHAAPVVPVRADEWQRMALRWPSAWLTGSVRWILYLAVGLHALGALAEKWGAGAPGFLRALPAPASLFVPVADPTHRAAGAAVVTGLLLLTIIHWTLGRLLPWVAGLQLGAMAWLTVRSGAPTAVLWSAAWLAVCVVCLAVALPAVQRAVMLRRWSERATGYTFVDTGASDQSDGWGGRRTPMVVGLVLVGTSVLWNGIARLLLEREEAWPPSSFGDLLPWGIGLLGVCLVVVDAVRALVGTLLRLAAPPMVIEFWSTGPGPLECRMDAGSLRVADLRELTECSCEAEARRRATDDEDGPLTSVRPARQCPHHGHRRVNELTTEEFLAVVGEGWLWADGAGVWAEDLADVRHHPGRVLGFGFEGVGGPERFSSLTEEHRRHGVRFVERQRFSLLRRHPPAPDRPTLARARRGEVIDTIDLTSVGIAGTAVRCTGEYPTFVPRERADERSVS